MGGKHSILQYLTLSEPMLRIESQDEYEVFPATHKDGSKCAVFMCNTDKSNYQESNLLDNCLEHLKSLRHPYILRYITSGVEVHPLSSVTYLVTEPIIPLELLIKTLQPEEICVGLHNIVEALVFLHEKAKICHNNLCMQSIFLAADGSWKLGGFEHACKFEEATGEYLKQRRALRYKKAIPPEENSDKSEIDVNLSCKRDAYAFGVLAEELLEYLDSLGDMTKAFELRILDDFQNPIPMKRPHLQSILEDRFFKNDYICIVKFLKMITLKSEQEKIQFFESCLMKLRSLPEELLAKRLSPLLLSRFVMLEKAAQKKVLPYLLVPTTENESKSKEEREGLLSPDVFQQHVIPELFKIFHVRDVYIRLVLLAYFPYYVHLFDKTKLSKHILPQIRLGLEDANDHLAEATLRALAECIPILGGNLVLGENRGKVFSLGVPKVTQTTDQCSDLIQNKSDISSLTEKITEYYPDQIQQKTDIELANGKVLLKDLAQSCKSSDKQQITEEEEEKKLEKLEKRKAELKLRREERKKKQLERKRTSNSNEHPVLNVPAASLENSNIVTVHEDVYVTTGTLSSIVTTDTKFSVNDDDQISRLTHSDTDEWCDWDNKEIHEPNSFDAEIEEELRNMPSTVEIACDRVDNFSTHSKKSILKDGNDLTSSKQRNNSNSVTGKSTRMKLKLSKESHKKVEFRKEKESPTDNWEQNSDWDNTSVHHLKQLSEKTKNKNTTLLSIAFNADQNSSKKNEDLGSEFEIKSVEIKKLLTPETDFFADMAPVIDLKLPELSDDNKINLDKKYNSYSNHKSGLSFSVKETSTEQAGEGWDDEFGWDVDS